METPRHDHGVEPLPLALPLRHRWHLGSDVICRLATFAGTWLDPSMWYLRLRGISVSFDGHLYDDPRFEVRGDREYEYARCVRCHQEIEMGYRQFWGLVA